MPQDIRFTPEELQKFAAEGKLTPEVIQKLHPSDRMVAVHELSKVNGDPRGMIFGPEHASTILAAESTPAIMGAGSLAGAGLATARALAPYLGSAAGAAIGGKFGHPYMGAMVGSLLTGGRGRPGRAKVAGKTVEAEASTAPVTFTGSAGPAPAPRMNGFSTPGQTTSTTTPNAARPPKLGAAEPQGTAPNVQKGSPTGPSGLNPTEAAEQVGRGIQNDFRGRVSFERPTNFAKREFPKGADKTTKPADFKALADADANGQVSNAEVEAIRRFLQGQDFGKTTTKTPTRLRKPK